jgi:hypothetical protein
MLNNIAAFKFVFEEDFWQISNSYAEDIHFQQLSYVSFITSAIII